MRYTSNYNMTIGEGTDAVNPLTQIFPNFETIDAAMEANKESGITTASEVTTGSVHAIVRVNTSVPVFRFTATSAWTTGDTMTLDGSAVTAHLTDGTAPKSGAYIIGAEVVGIVNGSLVTLLAGASFDGVLSFNSRQGVVLPQSGDYTANMIGYNNTASGLAATDTQSAIDELATGWTLGGVVTDGGVALPANFKELLFEINLDNVNVYMNIPIISEQLSATAKSFRSGYYGDNNTNGYVAISISLTNASFTIAKLNNAVVTANSTCTYYYR